jgi:predicted membrane protein
MVFAIILIFFVLFSPQISYRHTFLGLSFLIFFVSSYLWVVIKKSNQKRVPRKLELNESFVSIKIETYDFIDNKMCCMN